MQDLKTLETALNALAQKGDMATAVNQFYADDCSFQEGNQPARTGGKAGHLTYLADFFATVTKVNTIQLHGQAVGEGITISEWTFDMASTNGPVLWNEIIRRQWRDGKVVSERYYTAA
jgi:hypothetical protein